MAADAAMACEIGTSTKAPVPNTTRSARSRSIAGTSSGRGQSRKLLERPLARSASRTYASNGASSEKNPAGMSSPLRARMSGHSSWYLVIAFLPTAQTSRPKFRAASRTSPCGRPSRGGSSAGRRAPRRGSRRGRAVAPGWPSAWPPPRPRSSRRTGRTRWRGNRAGPLRARRAAPTSYMPPTTPPPASTRARLAGVRNPG